MSLLPQPSNFPPSQPNNPSKPQRPKLIHQYKYSPHHPATSLPFTLPSPKEDGDLNHYFPTTSSTPSAQYLLSQSLPLALLALTSHALDYALNLAPGSLGTAIGLGVAVALT